MFSHRAGVSALHSVKPCFYAQFGRFRRSRSATWRQSRESHPADQLASLVNEVFRYREYRTPLFIGVRGISFRVHSRIASFHSRIMCELTGRLPRARRDRGNPVTPETTRQAKRGTGDRNSFSIKMELLRRYTQMPPWLFAVPPIGRGNYRTTNFHIRCLPIIRPGQPNSKSKTLNPQNKFGWSS